MLINVLPVPPPPPPGPANQVQFDRPLADVPLEDAVASEANVLIVMDDSGSMDWGFMTDQSSGLFWISNANTKASNVRSRTRNFRYLYRLPTNIYGNSRNLPTQEALDDDSDFDGNDYGVWRGRNAQYSTVYYNPEIEYRPWVGLDRNNQEFQNVDWTEAPLDPYDAVGTPDVDCDSGTHCDLSALHTYTSNSVPTTQNDLDGRKNVSNTDVFYPYYWTTTAAPDTRPGPFDQGVRIVIDGNFPVTLDDGSQVNHYPGGPARLDCAVGDDDPLTCTWEQERQNFANWFSYYRSREYSAKAALGASVAAASNIRLGYSVLNNSNERLEIRSLNASFRAGHKADMLDQIYKIRSNGGTPLRRALDRAGRHFECVSGDAFGSSGSSNPGDPECPVLASPEGQCQPGGQRTLTCRHVGRAC